MLAASDGRDAAATGDRARLGQTASADELASPNAFVRASADAAMAQQSAAMAVLQMLQIFHHRNILRVWLAVRAIFGAGADADKALATLAASAPAPLA